MTPIQLDLLSGRAARDAALKAVLENAGAFTDQAREAFPLLFAKGDRIKGEDIRVALTDAGIEPHDPHAWGALTKSLIKREYIQPTNEWAQMQAETSHARMTRVYEVM